MIEYPQALEKDPKQNSTPPSCSDIDKRKGILQWKYPFQFVNMDLRKASASLYRYFAGCCAGVAG